MPVSLHPPSPELTVDRLERLEARVAQLELRLAAAANPTPSLAPSESAEQPALLREPLAETAGTADELELRVGQNWFAGAGILVFALGLGFLLSLPYASLPKLVPSLAGYGIVAALFIVARLAQRSFELVSGHLRAAAMALLYFSTLRLMFPAGRNVLAADSLAAEALLLLAVGVNLALALRRQSPWLIALSLTMGCVTGLVVGLPLLLCALLVTLAAIAVGVSLRHDWPALALGAIPLGYATYGLWVGRNPLRIGAALSTEHTLLGPAALLALVAIFSLGMLLRWREEKDEVPASIAALMNCGLGYSVFLVHTVGAFPTQFVPAHVAAAIVFLGIAVGFRWRTQSRVSTFFYAMTGYLALSVAILKWAPQPNVFVWLALQSVVVVATAIWFHSRLIVVANFFIYVAIMLAYLFMVDRESGISIGFGVVALVSARILNWQKDRLELKTELMRNAYLLSALLVFPYALYHLMPTRTVSLGWVGLALFYYAMNLIVRNQKYRWMGHATLLFTTLYLVLIGTSRFEPVYRVLSFLVLGTVLVAISLVFTRLRKRRSESAVGE